MAMIGNLMALKTAVNGGKSLAQKKKRYRPLYSGHRHDGRLVLLPPEKLGGVPHHALYTNSRPMNRAQVRTGERKKASGP